jgi:hypothetical protein
VALVGIFQLVRPLAPFVRLEHTAQLVRSVVIILTLRVPPVRIPTALKVVTHVMLASIKMKQGSSGSQQDIRWEDAKIVGVERTVQLVRPLAPSVRMVNSIPAQENNNVLNAPQVK